MPFHEDITEKSIDPGSQEMIRKAEKEHIETVWDRLEEAAAPVRLWFERHLL